MATQIEQLVVKLEADVKDLRRDMKRAEKDLNSSLKSIEKNTNRAGKAMGGLRSIVKQAASTMIGFLGANVLQAATRGLLNFAKSTVETAATVESLKVRLDVLKGSQEASTRAFTKFQQVAETVPFTLGEVISSGVTLQAFLTGTGVQAEDLSQTMADLAAFMGVGMQEAASSFGRAMAAGAGAADVLRERGVLSLIKVKAGVEDLTKLSLPEFRKVLLDVVQDSNSGIAGMADKLALTWQGVTSMLGDAVFKLKQQIGETLMPVLKELVEDHIKPAVAEAAKWVEANKELIKLRVKEWYDKVTGAVKAFFEILEKARLKAVSLGLLDPSELDKVNKKVEKLNKQIRATSISIAQMQRSNTPGKDSIIASWQRQLDAYRMALAALQKEREKISPSAKTPLPYGSEFEDSGVTGPSSKGKHKKVTIAEAFVPDLGDHEDDEYDPDKLNAFIKVMEKAGDADLASLRERAEAAKSLYQWREDGVLKAQENQSLLAEASHLEMVRKELENTSYTADNFFEAVGEGAKLYKKSFTSVSEQIRDATINSFKSMEDALVRFVMTGKVNLADLARQAAADLARIGIRQAITGPLAGALFGAHGMAMGGGRMIPFGKGGIVNRPTIIPMGNRTGVAGEQNKEEGVLPLARTRRGDLGVQLAGGGGQTTKNESIVNVTFNINAGVSPTIRAEVLNMLPMITEQTKGAVADAIRRGGRYSEAFNL